MKTKKTSVLSKPSATPTYAQVSQRARELWERDGCPKNRDLDYWLEAERQLGRAPVLQDDARRLTADPTDPASSSAAEVDAEIRHMNDLPGRRSATSATL